MELTSFQLPWTTQDEENRQLQESIKGLQFDPENIMPAGTYRVIDGQICRIIYRDEP